MASYQVVEAYRLVPTNVTAIVHAGIFNLEHVAELALGLAAAEGLGQSEVGHEALREG